MRLCDDEPGGIKLMWFAFPDGSSLRFVPDGSNFIKKGWKPAMPQKLLLSATEAIKSNTKAVVKLFLFPQHCGFPDDCSLLSFLIVAHVFEGTLNNSIIHNVKMCPTSGLMYWRKVKSSVSPKRQSEFVAVLGEMLSDCQHINSDTTDWH